MFLRNFWYVAAWRDEVRRQELFRRLILNEPIVFYRTEEGAPVALEDRCCHRHMPLSDGRLKGDNVECCYHGLVYNPAGDVVHIPSQKEIPRSARIKSYPTVDRYGWVWIWMGDPALADPSKIENFHWMDDDNWRFKGELLHVPAHYQLIVDNLMDLTHVQFVHPTTLGTSAVAAAPIRIEREGELVRVTRWVLKSPAPPFFQKVGRFAPDQDIDRWQIIEFRPPGFIWLDIGGALAGTGAPEGDRSKGISLRNHSIITPETEKTSHYFWSEGHNFRTDDETLTDLLFRQVHTAFLEDLAVVRAQQINIDLMPEAPCVDLAQDAGGIQARRIINRILAAEQQSVVPTAAE